MLHLFIFFVLLEFINIDLSQSFFKISNFYSYNNIPRTSYRSHRSQIYSQDTTSLDTTNALDTNNTSGQVFVCTNRYCREKGSDTTMACFTFFCPESIPVLSVNCLSRCTQGPNVRIKLISGDTFEATNIQSVEQVIQLLQTQFLLDLNFTTTEAYRLNLEGNMHVFKGNLDTGISCYDKALALGDHDQEGVLLVMRGQALLQRAYMYRLQHKDVLSMSQELLPDVQILQQLLMAFNPLPPHVRVQVGLDLLSRVSVLYDRLDASPRWAIAKAKWSEGIDNDNTILSGEDLLKKMQFYWSIYEHSLTGALDDLLAATIILPGFSQGWRRAGDALAEYRRFKAAIAYYKVAIRLDEGLSASLLPIVGRMEVMQNLVENVQETSFPMEFVLALADDRLADLERRI